MAIMILRGAHPHGIFPPELDAGRPRFLVAFGTIHAFASAAEHRRRYDYPRVGLPIQNPPNCTGKRAYLQRELKNLRVDFQFRIQPFAPLWTIVPILRPQEELPAGRTEP
jgi:hypothetical protein